MEIIRQASSLPPAWVHFLALAASVILGGLMYRNGIAISLPLAVTAQLLSIFGLVSLCSTVILLAKSSDADSIFSIAIIHASFFAAAIYFLLISSGGEKLTFVTTAGAALASLAAFFLIFWIVITAAVRVVRMAVGES
jgi:hypothetical protein